MLTRSTFAAALGLCLLATSATRAADQPDDLAELKKVLSKSIIKPEQPLQEMQAFCRTQLIPLPRPKSVAEWESYAANLRQQIFDNVIYRGEAAKWKDLPTEPVWLDTIPGGAGYTIRKLRFEAVPGMWVPALLYIPEKLSGKVPVVMAVNGHDRNGKAGDYKQARCINLAKRGMLVLNLEWLNMGQLRSPDFAHGRMNQLDLCGTSGIAPFFLSMKRGLDILLAHEHADPKRVAVSGLSGGGWQTIFISSLDTRVTLCNPVAGYSANNTRIDHSKDLGDSEQAPIDMAKYADYTHLTALLAPRPALLTYNAKDECCFEAGYALPPLVAAAQPFYELYGKKDNLRTHINHDPGTHNYLKENREAYYKMIGDHFYPGDKSYIYPEIPFESEIKTAAQLNVALPEGNAGFNTLAKQLARSLPNDAKIASDSKQAVISWQESKRKQLQQLMGARSIEISHETAVKYNGRKDQNQMDELSIARHQMTFEASDNVKWTLPIIEMHTKKWLGPATYTTDTVILSDSKPADLTEFAVLHTANGKNVWIVNVSGFNECEIPKHQYLFSMLMASQGRRPLDLASRQFEIIANNGAGCAAPNHRLKVIAKGPRAGLVALNALATSGRTGLRSKVALELHDCAASLHEILEKDLEINDAPEALCSGLLESFDIVQIAALCAPMPITFVNPSERMRKEIAPLRDVYRALGSKHDPLPAAKK